MLPRYADYQERDSKYYIESFSAFNTRAYTFKNMFSFEAFFFHAINHHLYVEIKVHVRVCVHTNWTEILVTRLFNGVTKR